MILWACTCGVDSKHEQQLQCISSVALAFKIISLQSTVNDRTLVKISTTTANHMKKLGMGKNAHTMHHLEHLWNGQFCQTSAFTHVQGQAAHQERSTIDSCIEPPPYQADQTCMKTNDRWRKGHLTSEWAGHFELSTLLIQSALQLKPATYWLMSMWMGVQVGSLESPNTYEEGYPAGPSAGVKSQLGMMTPHFGRFL